MSINERMFQIMDEKGIKMIDLCKKLSISKSVVSTWRKRGTNPPAEYIERICELLGVSIEYFITGQSNINKLLDEDEQELLDNFRLLPDKEKYRMLGKLEAITEEYKDKESPKSSTSRTG